MDSSSKLTIVKRAGVDLPLEIINFLDPKECLYLIKYFKKSPKRYAKQSFWDGRVVDLHSITERLNDKQIIKQVIEGLTPPMPSFEIEPQSMADLLAYMHSLN